MKIHEVSQYVVGSDPVPPKNSGAHGFGAFGDANGRAPGAANRGGDYIGVVPPL